MQFPGIRLTSLGADLLAKAQTGTTLEYTRVGLGAGKLPIDNGAVWAAGVDYAVGDVVDVDSGAETLVCTVAHTSELPEPDETDIKWDLFAGTPTYDSLTELFDLKYYAPISSLYAPGGGVARIRFRFSNRDVFTGFRLSEFGIFAQDPDVGEVLYGISFADEADFIPPGAGSTTMEKWVDVMTAIGQAENLTFTISELVVTASIHDVTAIATRAYHYAIMI